MTLTPTAPEEATGRATISWADVVTLDADQPASMQRRWMPIQYDQVDRGAFAGRFRELSVDGLTIASEQQNLTVLKRQYTPPEHCSVSVIREISAPGRCELDSFDTHTVGYMPGDREYEILMPPSDILFFQLDRGRVLEAADLLGCEIPGHGREPLFVNGLDPSQLFAMADTLMSSLSSCPGDAPPEVSRGYIGHLVMSHVVGAMAGMSGRSTRASSVNAHRITRGAHSLIEDAEDPLTVMDLCRELKISRATLQRCFEHIYGIPPLVYLRMHRLNAARRALIAARGTATTVTAVATKWGFFHLARFAKDYRDQFGELPSTTLGHHAGRRVHTGR